LLPPPPPPSTPFPYTTLFRSARPRRHRGPRPDDRAQAMKRVAVLGLLVLAGCGGGSKSPQFAGTPVDPPVPAPNFRLQDQSAKRSEEHTSELQSRSDLVCRLL